MYETLSAAVAKLDTYIRTLADLKAMVPAVQAGSVASLAVSGMPNAVPLPASLVVAGLNSEITRVTGLASVLKAKLDNAATIVG